MNLLAELIAARARMAEREHIQGYFYKLHTGRFTNDPPREPSKIVGCCAAGALFNGELVRGHFPAYRLLSQTAGGEDFLSSWNDLPGRTKAEVLELFDRAITQARSAP